MAARPDEGRSGSFAGRDGGEVPPGRLMLVHYVVARHGEDKVEVLRAFIEGKGETLPVFSAAWAARGYLFAEAPGGGWHVRVYTPDELIFLLTGSGIEWVALDSRPGNRGGCEMANVMPRENFVDYLLFSRAPFSVRQSDFETIEGLAHGRENGQ